jgi:predicted ester cyclase
MPEARGSDAFIEFDKVWWDACSDARGEITHLAVAGDTTFLRAVFRGTHDGVMRTPMGDIPATGSRVEGPYILISRWVGDKAIDSEILFDRMQVMEQLGLAPTTTTAASV